MNEKYEMDCSLVLEDLQEIGEGTGTRVTLSFNLLNV